MIIYFAEVTKDYDSLSDSGKTGTAIGTTIGLGLLFVIWIIPMIFALLLGTFLKKANIDRKNL